MNNKINPNRMSLIRTVFLITFIFAGSFQLLAQNKIVNVQVNRFWGGVSETGGQTSFSHPNINLFADYDVYGSRLQGNENYFGGFIAIAARNWVDNNGVTVPYAVFSPTDSYLPTGKVIKPLENYVRYPSPVYNVEQTNIPYIITDMGTVDPSKCIGTSDQSVTVTNEYACGVQLERKIMEWSQQFHDNYVIVDLTFTNTSNQTLHDFYVSLQEGDYYMQAADGNNPGVASVDATGDYQWFHYYGAKQTDSLRVMYQYSADDPTIVGDQMAQPHTQQYGRLLDKDFTFMAAIHASKAPYTPSGVMVNNIDQNDQDDPSQPKVAQAVNLQNVLNLPAFPLTEANNPSWYEAITGVKLASEDMTDADVWPGGHYRKNLDDMNLLTAGGQPGIFATANNFESLLFGFGPYEFEPGKQIRIVKVSGIAGLSREKALEIGRQWLAGTLTDPMPGSPKGNFPTNFRFPDEATPKDIYKNKWFSTGIDSVHQTVSRAKYNFRTGYKAPTTPPPPTSTTVLGTGEGVEITWSDPEAESLPNFQGYRIMRKVSNRDTTFYEEVTRTSPTDKAQIHTYIDDNILFGAQYYYYIQAGVKIDANDQNAHPTERGKTIWSGRIWYANNTFAQGKRSPQDNLAEIVMVPNPYNYNDPLLRGYGDTGYRGIRFFNLPVTVTIKILTEYGDLVKTIEHDTPLTKDGYELWDMTNENRQPVASGVYVVVFQTPDGRLSYQKLVVAR